MKERITKKEFQNLSEQVKEVVAEHGKVRLLLHINEVPNMALSTIAEDLKLAPYANDIERYAIVGDSAVVEWVEKLGGFLIAGEVKHFEDSQYEESWRWVRS